MEYLPQPDYSKTYRHRAIPLPLSWPYISSVLFPPRSLAISEEKRKMFPVPTQKKSKLADDLMIMKASLQLYGLR
jgi:hypothetical protein